MTTFSNSANLFDKQKTLIPFEARRQLRAAIADKFFVVPEESDLEDMRIATMLDPR